MALVWISRAAIDRAAMKKRIRYGPGEPSDNAKGSRAKKRVCGVATAGAGCSNGRPGTGSNSKPDGRAVMSQVHGLDIVSKIYLASGQRPSSGNTKQLIVRSSVHEAMPKRGPVLESDLDFSSAAKGLYRLPAASL
jgi:hypothetical protein